MKFLILLTLVLTSSVTFAEEGGSGAGNGGDAIVCKIAGDSRGQWYSLDFLRTNDQHLPLYIPGGFEQSFDRIERNLVKKVPALAKSFKNFSRNLFNRYDRSEKYVWKAAMSKALINIADENFDWTLAPESCRLNGKPQVVQAVVRKVSRDGKKIKFLFVPKAIERLEKTPVQLSFLLVHEWLWDHSSNVRVNRAANLYLHSLDFDLDTPEQATAKLQALGLL